MMKSVVRHLDNNNNGNNQGINFKDFEEEEDYEPTNDFNQISSRYSVGLITIRLTSWNRCTMKKQPYSPRRNSQYGQIIFIISKKTSGSGHQEQCKMVGVL
jgi:hypothetical protein